MRPSATIMPSVREAQPPDIEHYLQQLSPLEQSCLLLALDAQFSVEDIAEIAGMGLEETNVLLRKASLQVLTLLKAKKEQQGIAQEDIEHEIDFFDQLSSLATASPSNECDDRNLARPSFTHPRQISETKNSFLRSFKLLPKLIGRYRSPIFNPMDRKGIGGSDGFSDSHPQLTTGDQLQKEINLRAGQALGHYQLVRLLDYRRPVEVWLGQHISVPMQVALKVLPRDGQEEEEYQHAGRRLQNEALVLADLHHQHIVTLRDYLRGRNFHALVLEYAPYGSVPRYHGTGRKLPLSLIRLYTWQIGQALTALHEHNLLHRDVKPSNILLLNPRHALLADFGLALYASVLTAQQRPHQGGTPAYMAPEQQRGYPCPASDQYGLAVSVYEWLTGHRPFSSKTGQRMSKGEHLEPLPVRSLRPELPTAVDEILRIALHPDPAQRYPSVLDFARDFVEATRTSRPPLVQRMPYDRGTRGREAAPKSVEQATNFQRKRAAQPKSEHSLMAAQILPRIG